MTSKSREVSDLRLIPKNLIELHLHLEGAVYPPDALKLSRGSVRELSRLYRHQDFKDFLTHFGKIVSFFKSREDIAFLLETHLKRLESQGCVYAEFRISPSVWEHYGLDAGSTAEYILGLDFPGAVKFNFIIEAVRQWDRALIERDLTLALKHKDKVRGFGLGGDEIKAPLAGFSWLAEECGKNGIMFIPHAGEVSGAEEVLTAVAMGVKRIGHGIKAAESAEACRVLKEEQVHLEVCPTSNIKTGAVKETEVHPLKWLRERNVPFSVSTDDPGLFLTTLRKELYTASRIAGLDGKGIISLQLEALRASLLTDAEKENLKFLFFS
jgi:adenosine deaminase